MSEQTADTIRAAATRLDDALQTTDTEAVVACFSEDCEVELLGTRLSGRDGVRRWLRWMGTRGIQSLWFTPRSVVVEGNVFVEEFLVSLRMVDGRTIESRQTEVLVYENNLVKSLRLYFDPTDFAEMRRYSPVPYLATLMRTAARQGLEWDQLVNPPKPGSGGLGGKLVRDLSAAAFAVLGVIQLLGISGAVIAAAVEVETIVGTGPAFSLLGLAVCFGWLVSRSYTTIVFGLSATAISVSLLALIAGLRWSPQDASIPVPLILLAYEAMIVPVGLVSLHRTIARGSWKSSRRAWQYNIWSLLAVTAVAGAAAAVVRLAMQFGAPVLVTTAIGVSAATVAAIAVVVYRALRRLPPVRVQPPPSPILGKPAHSL
jgi:ketosteroid isomerase-like protein